MQDSANGGLAMMNDINRRKLLKSAFCLAVCGFAGFVAIQFFGMRDAQAWGILPSVIVSGSGAAACTAGNDSNCVLLIHSNTTDGSTTFVDSSQGGADHTADITASGDVHHETDQQKFGATSIETWGANTSILSIADSADWDFGTGDFDIEFYVRWKGAVANSGLLGRYTAEAGTWALQYSAGTLYWYYGNGTSWNKAWTPVADTWYHICIARASNTTRWFVGGTQIGTSETDNNDYDTAAALEIGRYASVGGTVIDGYFDEIAIFKGSANGRTANFTPPISAYCD